MTNRLLAVFLGGFTAGILFRSFFDFGFAFSFFVTGIAVAIFLSNKAVGSRTPFATPQFVSLFLFVAALGMFRYDLSELHTYDSVLNRQLNSRVIFVSEVIDEPDEREDSVRLTVAADSLIQGEIAVPVSAKILVVTDLYPKFGYGDKLEVSGLLTKPKNFADAGGKIFDYQAYLAKEGIYYQMTRPTVKLLASGQGNIIVSKLFELKQAFLLRIGKIIPEPHASLLGGLVIGAKHSLGKKLLDDFRTVGVIHIVVLSGYNITIIAYFIEWLFSRLRKNLRLICASAGIILFAIMVGASATVVRATIMALLALLARGTGRGYVVTRALLIAGFFMLLHNPKILVFDVSFQLSFLATVGLIYFSPLIEPKVKWVTEKWKLREIVVATISTQIFVLPFLLYKTGLFSIVSLPVNLLILTAIPA
ncbi:MAG: ComEC/Rec2 family competence protein, partial [bacterium]|nr:ComEC/Rec2 family competence protein [bacterium]